MTQELNSLNDSNLFSAYLPTCKDQLLLIKKEKQYLQLNNIELAEKLQQIAQENEYLQKTVSQLERNIKKHQINYKQLKSQYLRDIQSKQKQITKLQKCTELLQSKLTQSKGELIINDPALHDQVLTDQIQKLHSEFLFLTQRIKKSILQKNTEESFFENFKKLKEKQVKFEGKMKQGLMFKAIQRIRLGVKKMEQDLGNSVTLNEEEKLLSRINSLKKKNMNLQRLPLIVTTNRQHQQKIIEKANKKLLENFNNLKSIIKA